jgi:choline dehydrogenase
LLSGIGDPQELQALGIAPVVELPEVGRNLVDHILLGVAFGSATKINGRNPFVTESCAFVPSNPGVVGSNIQISFVKEKHYVEGYDAPEHCFTIIPGLVRPQSRGSITLRSSDPSVSPLIDPRYLSETADVDDFVSGIQISREIGKTKAFSPWTTGEAAPGPDCSTDAEIRNYIKSVATTWFHPVGTCRMGIDSRAVVDPELRVQGVANLRIADASIMPTIVSCNTNAASIMIGWKAGELIANSRKS